MKRQILRKLFPAVVMGLSVALMPWSGSLAAVADANVAATSVAPAVPAPQTVPDKDGKLSAPTREVVKLSASGMSEDVIKAYIANSPNTFNLTPDDLVHLQGTGVSSAVMAAMLIHDTGLQQNSQAYASTMPPPTAPPPNTPPPSDTGYDTSAPANSVSVYNTQPEGSGSWSYDDGYGSYWQPYSPYVYYYPWGTFNWCFFPGRGWCWFSLGFRGHGGFGFDRFGHGFERGFHGRSFNTFGRTGGVQRSFASPGFHTFGGGMGHSFGGGHVGGFSGGHSGGFSGGHSGGFSGGHSGGGMGRR